MLCNRSVNLFIILIHDTFDRKFSFNSNDEFHFRWVGNFLNWIYLVVQTLFVVYTALIVYMKLLLNVQHFDNCKNNPNCPNEPYFSCDSQVSCVHIVNGISFIVFEFQIESFQSLKSYCNEVLVELIDETIAYQYVLHLHNDYRNAIANGSISELPPAGQMAKMVSRHLVKYCEFFLHVWK